jgi:hypothetical protein
LARWFNKIVALGDFCIQIFQVARPPWWQTAAWQVTEPTPGTCRRAQADRAC